MAKLPDDAKYVLLVDDEKVIVDFLERFLKRLNIASIAVTSGEEALEVYSRAHFDLVLLDIQLGGIDGLYVLEKIKQKDPSVKAIMITGRAEKVLQERALSLGALDYITKPLDLSELRAKLGRYLK
jgi:DNA-binding response OmpR family regulator